MLGEDKNALELQAQRPIFEEPSPLLLYQPPRSTAVNRSMDILSSKSIADDQEPFYMPTISLASNSRPVSTTSAKVLVKSASFVEKDPNEDNSYTYAENKFAFFEDYILLNNFEEREIENVTNMATRDIDKVRETGPRRLPKYKVAQMLWNAYVHVKYQPEPLLNDEQANQLIDIIGKHLRFLVINFTDLNYGTIKRAKKRTSSRMYRL